MANVWGAGLVRALLMGPSEKPTPQTTTRLPQASGRHDMTNQPTCVRAPRLTPNLSDKACIKYTGRAGQRPRHTPVRENYLNSLKYPINLAINTLEGWYVLQP